LKGDKVKVAIALKKSSTAFLKEPEKKHNTSHPKRLREAMEWYEALDPEHAEKLRGKNVHSLCVLCTLSVARQRVLPLAAAVGT
jgi:hypothetical protein